MQISRRSAIEPANPRYEVAPPNAQPRHILEKIVWHKQIEVTQMREKLSLEELKRQVERVSPPRDFLLGLQQSPARPSLIAEVKKASPSRGIIRSDFEPIAIAQAYATGGAACLSVLTDSKFFQGSFDNLRLIRKKVSLPLLCKEFMIDPYQIYLARSAGADAVLLIAAVLCDQDLQEFWQLSHDLGMNALVEVHSEAELDRVLQLSGLRLLGINNRNLADFTVSLETTRRLLSDRTAILQDRNLTVVSESGLNTPADLDFVAAAGARSVLIGESLVKQPDLVAATQSLTDVFSQST